MLVLSRFKDQKIYIGDNIVIQVISIRGDKVRIGIEAPTEVRVDREEVRRAIDREQAEQAAQEAARAALLAPVRRKGDRS